MQFPDSTFWPLVLTSAAVASLVSAGATLFGQAFERRARGKELLLTKAIELAQDRSKRTMDLWERSGAKASAHFQDDIVSAETHFKWLESLWARGSLPDDSRIERLGPREKRPTE